MFRCTPYHAGWGKPLPAGHGLGIAVHESFGSFVAQVAEVSVPVKGAIRVHLMVCAIDCGRIVDPDRILLKRPVPVLLCPVG
ncbi:hypothetical protein [Geobacter argillaceus]|uniref:Isoquinoline 1-oxidoreductase beta subunit n=1 Tax=Geobacter argillaceus TaxID=345631 RepID=A0A562WT30_9BACT|nr:hypothetical protein [Geobacter argillaceus]TWJ33593.1 isoquinoline 1-oxidoreductase beta subunit [Geobacter argillaceus]